MLDLAVRDGRLPRTPATGVRLPRAEKGEAAAVRVRRVDLMKRRIEVVHTAIELNGEMTYGTPKTHQRRSIPIPRSLVDASRSTSPARRPTIWCPRPCEVT